MQSNVETETFYAFAESSVSFSSFFIVTFFLKKKNNYTVLRHHLCIQYPIARHLSPFHSYQQ